MLVIHADGQQVAIAMCCAAALAMSQKRRKHSPRPYVAQVANSPG